MVAAWSTASFNIDVCHFQVVSTIPTCRSCGSCLYSWRSSVSSFIRNSLGHLPNRKRGMLQLYKWTCYKYISPGNFFVGVSRLVLRTLTLFQTQKCNLPHPFSDLASKVRTHFQTWRWSQNATYSHVYKDKSCHFLPRLACQQKDFLKIKFQICILLFLLHSFWSTFIQYCSPLENLTWFHTKMGKIYTRFQTKTAQKHLPIWLT